MLCVHPRCVPVVPTASERFARRVREGRADLFDLFATAAGRRSPFLDSSGNCCNKPSKAVGEVVPDGVVDVADRWELAKVRCKSWFCPECAKWQGLRLRRRLLEIVKGWSDVRMISVTVDQTLFPNAQAAYEWVREHRGISVLIQGLKRRGLITGKYLAVLEFQNLEKGGWPHWHILVEAGFIDVYQVSELWGKLRPKGIERVGKRPMFGTCHIRRFDGKEHGVNYATKYLIKEPKDGWPDWVLCFEGRVARYSCSRGLWGVGHSKPRPEVDYVGVPHAATCFCESCRAGIDSATGKQRRKARTVEERVQRCGVGSLLFRVRVGFDADGEPVRTEREYLGFCRRGFGELCGVAGVEERRSGRVALGVAEFRRVRGDFFECSVAEKFDRTMFDYVPF